MLSKLVRKCRILCVATVTFNLLMQPVFAQTDFGLQPMPKSKSALRGSAQMMQPQPMASLLDINQVVISQPKSSEAAETGTKADRYSVGEENSEGVSLAQSGNQRSKADMVLLGGNVYTVDAARTWAQAVAVSDGKIVYVGDDAGAQRWIGGSTKVQDLDGRMVLPGFHDSHVHLTDGGTALSECELDDEDTKEKILEKIRSYSKSHTGDAWITGGGWALPAFPDSGPTKEDFDSAVADRPALMYSQDYHSVWANSAALRAAKITKKTPDPEHGRIERDPTTGEPSGTLREEAMELLNGVSPKLTDNQRAEGLSRAIELANKFGITSVQDADADADVLNAYLEVQRRGKLTLKVVTALHVEPDKGAKQISQLLRMREKFSQGRVHATSVKIFADGVIESHTASLLQPYDDKPGYNGIANYTQEKMDELVSVLSMAGFQVHVHAIGDAAVREALNAFEQARTVSTNCRHEIAHLEVISPDDLQRFRTLGVIANCQAFWAFNDPYITKQTIPAIGPKRSQNLYMFQSLVNSGATIVGGSDWNVTSLNPLDAIEVAVTRQSTEPEKEPPLLPEQRLSLPDIIAAYTINGAFCNHEEHLTGSLESGKAADLIVLDKNLFAIPPTEIHNAKVVLTLLDGQEVYRDDSFPQRDVASSRGATMSEYPSPDVFMSRVAGRGKN